MSFSKLVLASYAKVPVFRKVGETLDSDAAAFISATGATDTKSINDWVTQMKVAGLGLP